MVMSSKHFGQKFFNKMTETASQRQFLVDFKQNISRRRPQKSKKDTKVSKLQPIQFVLLDARKGKKDLRTLINDRPDKVLVHIEKQSGMYPY